MSHFPSSKFTDVVAVLCIYITSIDSVPAYTKELSNSARCRVVPTTMDDTHILARLRIFQRQGLKLQAKQTPTQTPAINTIERKKQVLSLRLQPTDLHLRGA